MTQPILLVRSGGAAALPEWQSAFAAVMPDLEVRWWDDATVDAVRVHYVLVWEPEPGRIARLPNLRAVFSAAAGVDHLVRDPDLPKHLPIVRMGADEIAQTVAEYVCLGALACLRDLPRIVAGQRERRWETFNVPRTARHTRVGIMGLGRIGLASAAMLSPIGFAVHGWSRTAREGGTVPCRAGMASLDAFLAESEILVGLLPDTPETRGLLDARRLAMLPRGAGVVSAGRGTLIVQPALLAALDSGALSCAVLDVFPEEPLPPADPAWSHPRVIVTGHVAGNASRPSRAASVAENIRRLERGEMPDTLYDPARGY